MVTLSVYLVAATTAACTRLATAMDAGMPIRVEATAHDEWRALQWLAQKRNVPDLVIVDIFLKAGSGLGVLRRSHRMAHGRPFVVLSDFASADLRRKCAALGADQVFDKTTEIDSLLAYCGNLAAGMALH